MLSGWVGVLQTPEFPIWQFWLLRPSGDVTSGWCTLTRGSRHSWQRPFFATSMFTVMCGSQGKILPRPGQLWTRGPTLVRESGYVPHASHPRPSPQVWLIPICFPSASPHPFTCKGVQEAWDVLIGCTMFAEGIRAFEGDKCFTTTVV